MDDPLQYGAAALMLVVIGISTVLVVSQERIRTNALLSGATLMVALALGSTPVFVNQVDPAHPDVAARLQGLFEAASLAMYAGYLLGLLALSSLTGARARTVRLCAWVAVGLGAWHAIASYAWPAQRLNDYEFSLGQPGVLSSPGFWLFATFWLIVAIPFTIGYVLISLGELDSAEARRAQSAVLASALAIAITATPPAFLPVVVALWISVLTFGQLQYVSARAERGVFLSRFLSPRVTEIVSMRGLADTMKPHNAELTVVSADLRGFTSYSEGVPSQSVVDLLTDYYDAVGEVAARHGATITNYAGDGVLILVGAPIPDPRHAATGIRLGQELLGAVEPVIARWQTRIHALGLGVGVASGEVTVGAISAKTRMEYTAVGMPVNLAARLCAIADAGNVLIDARAARLSDAQHLHNRGELPIKGFSDPQQVYALKAGL